MRRKGTFLLKSIYMKYEELLEKYQALLGENESLIRELNGYCLAVTIVAAN